MSDFSRAVSPSELPTNKNVANKKIDLNTIQFWLDVAGLCPVIGFVPDLINGGIFILRGRYVEGGLSLLAAVPGVGLAASGGKYINKSIKVVGQKYSRQIVRVVQEKGVANTYNSVHKGIGDFISNSKSFSTIRKNHKEMHNWTKRTKNNLKTESLDHWLIPQKLNKWVQSQDFFSDAFKMRFQNLHNGGWNLIELPGANPFHTKLGLNEWMGFAPNWGGSHARKAKMVRFLTTTSIPASVINGLLKGHRIGSNEHYNEPFNSSPELKDLLPKSLTNNFITGSVLF